MTDSVRGVVAISPTGPVTLPERLYQVAMLAAFFLAFTAALAVGPRLLPQLAGSCDLVRQPVGVDKES